MLSYSLAINYTFDEVLSTAGDPTQIKITTINVPLMVSQCDYYRATYVYWIGNG